MFSLICIWINGWINNRESGDLRRQRGHYDVNVMVWPRIPYHVSTHWGGDKRADISQTTFSNVFSYMKIYEFRWIFHWFVPQYSIMAWCRSGDKLLSESMMENLLTHICVTRPQWVKWMPVSMPGNRFTDTDTLLSQHGKVITCPVNCGVNYLPIPILRRLHCWSLEMDKQFHPTIGYECNYLPMRGLSMWVKWCQFGNIWLHFISPC